MEWYCRILCIHWRNETKDLSIIIRNKMWTIPFPILKYKRAQARARVPVHTYVLAIIIIGIFIHTYKQICALRIGGSRSNWMCDVRSWIGVMHEHEHEHESCVLTVCADCTQVRICKTIFYDHKCAAFAANGQRWGTFIARNLKRLKWFLCNRNTKQMIPMVERVCSTEKCDLYIFKWQ